MKKENDRIDYVSFGSKERTILELICKGIEIDYELIPRPEVSMSDIQKFGCDKVTESLAIASKIIRGSEEDIPGLKNLLCEHMEDLDVVTRDINRQIDELAKEFNKLQEERNLLEAVSELIDVMSGNEESPDM